MTSVHRPVVAPLRSAAQVERPDQDVVTRPPFTGPIAYHTSARPQPFRPRPTVTSKSGTLVPLIAPQIEGRYYQLGLRSEGSIWRAKKCSECLPRYSHG